MYFKPIKKKAILNKLSSIATGEDIDINDKCMNVIVEITEGDVRRSIMTLQNTKYIINYAGKITENDIIKMISLKWKK